MLRAGTYAPNQCCAGYCVPVTEVGDDDDLIKEDTFVHDLRSDQAERLSELLERLTSPGTTGGA